jgi:hypothetical protein
MSDTAANAPSVEQTIVQNGFGTVTNKRVIYNRQKSWFSGGSREDIPLKHVTSVRLETSRMAVLGVLLLLIGLPMIRIAGLGLLLIALGVLLIWGSPTVVVNAAGNDLSKATGLPWDKADANTFVEALRK